MVRLRHVVVIFNKILKGETHKSIKEELGISQHDLNETLTYIQSGARLPYKVSSWKKQEAIVRDNFDRWLAHIDALENLKRSYRTTQPDLTELS